MNGVLEVGGRTSESKEICQCWDNAMRGPKLRHTNSYHASGKGLQGVWIIELTREQKSPTCPGALPTLHVLAAPRHRASPLPTT